MQALVAQMYSGMGSPVLQVGRDFLPRGAGICTRRPLNLHLRRTEPTTTTITNSSAASASSAQGAEEWAEFAHRRKETFTDFDAVREEIDAETTRLLGSSGKDVSDKPIHLTIHSPHVLCAATHFLLALPSIYCDDGLCWTLLCVADIAKTCAHCSLSPSASPLTCCQQRECLQADTRRIKSTQPLLM